MLLKIPHNLIATVTMNLNKRNWLELLEPYNHFIAGPFTKVAQPKSRASPIRRTSLTQRAYLTQRASRVSGGSFRSRPRTKRPMDYLPGRGAKKHEGRQRARSRRRHASLIGHGN